MGESENLSFSFAEALLRRPMLLAAVLLAAGIAAHGELRMVPGVWLIVAGGLLIGSIAGRGWSWIGDGLLAGAVFFAGVAAGQIAAHYYPEQDIGLFTTDRPRLGRLELRITQPPRILRNVSWGNRLSPRQVSQAVVERVLTRRGWQAASGRVLLQVDDPHPELAVGQRVVALGMLSRPAPAMNPGQFDWSVYYREQRVLATLNIAHAQNIEIEASPGPSPLEWLRQFVRRALGLGFEAQSLDHALLRALVLGDSDPQLRDVQEDFIRTGTSHHLAISGMHIAILGGFVFLVCRAAFVPPRLATWIGMGFVILYGLVALPSPPVVRSVLLCTAFGVGLLSRRAVDGIQLLAVSVFLMLIYHPLDLYNAGFQLSFGTVLGLMLFTKPTVDFLESLRDRDVQIALSVRRPTRVEAFLRQMGYGLVQALVAAVVAWAVSTPLVAWHFNQINPWAIAASFVLAIPVLVALIGGFLKIVLTLALPYLAGTWAMLAGLPIALMRYIVELLALIPGSDAALARPGIGLILAFYLLLALPVLPWPAFRFRVWLRCGPVLACALVPLLPWLSVVQREGSAGRLGLTLLSVGAGQCLVLHLPSGQLAMIDAGSSSMADLSRRCIRPYLKTLGVRRVETLFISHANHDHFSAAADVVEEHGAQQVILPPHFEEHARTNESARSLLAELRSLNCRVRLVSAGQQFAFEEGVVAEVLWPPVNRELEPNDSSLVLRLSFGGRSILISGDIQDVAQRELLAGPNRLRADVLIAPHHGSSVASTAAFLAAVNPQIILCSNDRTLTGKQREFDDLAADRPLYRTHASGAISVGIAATGQIQVETFRGPRVGGAHESP